MDGKEIRLWEI